MGNCIFCEIVKGNIPSDKIYENDRILVFKDINPVSKIHYLAIPKVHVKSILDIDDSNFDIIAYIHKTIKKIAFDIGFDKNGFRIVNNTGTDGGQLVDHLHFHVLAGNKLDTKIG